MKYKVTSEAEWRNSFHSELSFLKVISCLLRSYLHILFILLRQSLFVKALPGLELST